MIQGKRQLAIIYILRCYSGLLPLDTGDFQANTVVRDDDYFQQSLDSYLSFGSAEVPQPFVEAQGAWCLGLGLRKRLGPHGWGNNPQGQFQCAQRRGESS